MKAWDKAKEGWQKAQTALKGACAAAKGLPSVVWAGLCVLVFEGSWLIGPDLDYWGRLRAMRRQREELRERLARMSTLADPGCDLVRGDLALLERDLRCVERARAERRAMGLEEMAHRLPPAFR